MRHTISCSQKSISCGSLFQEGNNVSGSADFASYPHACYLCKKLPSHDQSEGPSLDNYSPLSFIQSSL